MKGLFERLCSRKLRAVWLGISFAAAVLLAGSAFAYFTDQQSETPTPFSVLFRERARATIRYAYDEESLAELREHGLTSLDGEVLGSTAPEQEMQVTAYRKAGGDWYIAEGQYQNSKTAGSVRYGGEKAVSVASAAPSEHAPGGWAYTAIEKLSFTPDLPDVTLDFNPAGEGAEADPLHAPDGKSARGG